MKAQCIAEKNFLCSEFIGLRAKVIGSSDAGRIGVSGRIVDETMNLLVLETKEGEKKIPKKEVVIKFFLPNRKQFVVDCKKIMFRPEDRVKALVGKKIED